MTNKINYADDEYKFYCQLLQEFKTKERVYNPHMPKEEHRYMSDLAIQLLEEYFKYRWIILNTMYVSRNELLDYIEKILSEDSDMTQEEAIAWEDMIDFADYRTNG